MELDEKLNLSNAHKLQIGRDSEEIAFLDYVAELILFAPFLLTNASNSNVPSG